MIGECVDEDREFGIVWMSDDGLCDVGCAARVTEVLDRLEDGRMNILAQGTRPFRLVRRIDDMPYPAGDVELLDDEPSDPEPDLESATRSGYGDLVERVTDERPADDELSGLDAYGMAATIDFGLDAKQGLLEQRSEAGRLRRLRELFVATVRRLDSAERAREVASSNGKVRF